MGSAGPESSTIDPLREPPYRPASLSQPEIWATRTFAVLCTILHNSEKGGGGIYEYAEHEAAGLFRQMTKAEFNGLVDDIREHGQIEPIWLHEGKVLDGRHRLKACRELDVEPVIETWEGEDPVVFVISKNKHRRHLTKPEQKALAVELLKHDPEQSNRRVAEATGLSDKTVAKVRDDAESTAEITQLTTRRGKDGRTRSAPPKKRRKPKPQPDIPLAPGARIAPPPPPADGSLTARLHKAVRTSNNLVGVAAEIEANGDLDLDDSTIKALIARLQGERSTRARLIKALRTLEEKNARATDDAG